MKPTCRSPSPRRRRRRYRAPDQTYRLDVKNNGPAAAANTTVSDSLPTGLTFVSASNGCSFASGKVTCPIGTMAAGATKTFTVVAKVPQLADASGSRTPRRSARRRIDSNNHNNTSTVVTPVGPVADLGITKVASTGSVTAGGQVTYTLFVTNNGPDDASVTVTDPLPAGETLSRPSPARGLLRCDLQSGVDRQWRRAQILVTVNIAASARGQIQNTASVIGNNPDDHQKNNHGGSTVVVPNPPTPPQPMADLPIVTTVNHGRAYPGQTLTYTLEVINHGPDAASNAKVTDTASMGMKVLSAKPSRGSCKVGRPITCSLGTIARRQDREDRGQGQEAQGHGHRGERGSRRERGQATPSRPNNLEHAKTNSRAGS